MIIYSFFAAMRQCLAILFMVIFAFQVLPVKAIGKLLGKGQTTEEVEGGNYDYGKADKFNDVIFTFPHAVALPARDSYFQNKLSAIIHRAEALFAVHVPDVPSPPPDC